jgi:hypothetical protein
MLLYTLPSDFNELKCRLERQLSMFDEEGDAESSGQRVAVGPVRRSSLAGGQPQLPRPVTFVVGRGLDQDHAAGFADAVHGICRQKLHQFNVIVFKLTYMPILQEHYILKSCVTFNEDEM